MVTFDDAYDDFAEHAWPVLRRHGLPVTLFVPTAYPDHPERAFWWDRLHRLVAAAAGALTTPVGTMPVATPAQRHAALDALRGWVTRRPHHEALAAIAEMEASADAGDPGAPPAVLGWAALRSLAAAGVMLAAHTRTHPCLDRLPLAEARAEVLGSLDDLARETGAAPPRVVAFPGGRTTEALAGALARDGLEAAFTTARGANRVRGIRWMWLRRINVGRRTSIPVLRAQLLSFTPARSPAA
jgi:peptidoglycan/xylan/chitin deacetylase (PgdA/CDA1 family)